MKNGSRQNAKSSSSKKSTRTRKTSAKGNQREQIIITASKLFQEQGYNKTSLSEIARQIGLDQSSIYYWFPSKEAIFESIYDPNRSTPILERIIKEVDDPITQLYMLIVYDAMHKCKLPFDFAELESLVHDHPEKYEGLLNGYREYYQTLKQVISRGIEKGVFNDCLVDEQAVTIISINEGLQHHYHAKQRNELILISSGYEVKNHTPEAVGHMSARTIIPGMLSEPQDMDALRTKALKMLEEQGLSTSSIQ